MKVLLQLLIAEVIFLALASSFVYCYDPNPLQDYCVAVNDINGVFVNGKFCKDPRNVTSDDFFTSGLNVPGNYTNNPLNTLRFNATEVNVDRIPGLNTLGVSLVRSDYAPGGQVPPHIHPRGSEIIVCLKGKLYVGFVSSDDDNNRLFSKILYPGDVFVYPKGLIHFSKNIGKKNAVAFFAGGSQNLGFISVANAVFGSKPRIDPYTLAEAFQLDVNTVKYLQERFDSDEEFDNIRPVI